MSAAQDSPPIEKTWAKIEYLTGEAREKAMAEVMEKSRRYRESLIHDAYLDGLEEGRLEGRLEARLEAKRRGRLEVMRDIAKNLLRHKVPVEIIVNSTDLTLAEINALAAEPGAMNED